MSTLLARLRVESLEFRECPTTASLYNSVLTVQGTDGTDHIRVLRNGDWVGAAGEWFPVTAIKQLVITAGGGDDTIRDDSTLSAVIFGGAGNDRIHGGRGHDIVFGGAGNDVLFGDRGADILYGGGGSDQIDGGPGFDTVYFGSPDRTVANSPIETEIIDMVNAYRDSYGIKPLSASPELNAAAALHSADMIAVARNFGPLAAIQHTLYGTARPQITDRLDAVGYDTWTRSIRYGENLALGYATAKEVVDAWMSSPEHRANILDPGFTETGVAVRRDSLGQLYITQDFGRLR
ncbi:MAG TPA: CAP domain-containing protein [Gemmata sp.]|nr:CAP domain-containing protein [Gemmata sp.]